MNRSVLAVIPARLGSKRFSGKVLYPYRDKPLLFYVWREVKRVKHIDRLVIATDSMKIARAAEDFGAEAVMTSKRHRTGSDRAAEVAGKLGGEIVINIQADNFGVRPALYERAIETMLREPSIDVGTLAGRIMNDEDLFDPNLVKVVMSKSGRALWFSRFPLPYLQHPARGARVSQYRFWGHIGVYFYRRAALKTFAKAGQTMPEKAESLEQLRILELGGRMNVFTTRTMPVTVDSPRDVKKLDDVYN